MANKGSQPSDLGNPRRGFDGIPLYLFSRFGIADLFAIFSSALHRSIFREIKQSEQNYEFFLFFMKRSMQQDSREFKRYDVKGLRHHNRIEFIAFDYSK